MRETLRLGPTAPLRAIYAAENTVIGGKYAIEKGNSILINFCTMMRDPKVWGEDVSGHLVNDDVPSSLTVRMQADQFRPERMLDGKFEALPVS